MGLAMSRVLDREAMQAAFRQAAETARVGAPEERAGRVRPMRLVATLRLDLGLGREEFAARYRVPIETLEGWERGTIEPDSVALAFLRLIAADPDGVAAKLSPKEKVAAMP